MLQLYFCIKVKVIDVITKKLRLYIYTIFLTHHILIGFKLELELDPCVRTDFHFLSFLIYLITFLNNRLFEYFLSSYELIWT